MAFVRRLTPQPLIGGLVGSGALLLVLTSIWADRADGGLAWDPRSVLLALVLSVATGFALRYPIHMRIRTKASVSTVSLFLMAVLLPPWLASLAAGVTTLCVELIERRHTGNEPADMATSAGRWTVIIWCGASVVQFADRAGIPGLGGLCLTAAFMLCLDMATAPLELAPMTDEPALRVLRNTIRDCVLLEAVQYLLAILGALAAAQNVWTLLFLAVPTGIVYWAFRNVSEMQTRTRAMIEAMADAVDLRDAYTGGHSRRVTEFCRQILNQLGLSGPESDLVLAAAYVHDIGKISVPDSILHKPGPLSLEEWAIMQAHAPLGAELLRGQPDFERGASIIRHHHERWDGRGYPDGLAGHMIPFGARVIAVADSFDAMTSDRPYRGSLSPSEAAEVLRRERGRQWDPTIVDAFLGSLCIEEMSVTVASSASSMITAQGQS